MNKVQQLEAQLLAAKQEAAALAQLQRETLREAGKAFLSSKPYEYRTTNVESTPSYWIERDGVANKARLRIERRVHPQKLTEFCKAHNTEWTAVANALGYGHEPLKWQGMVYLLTEENILTSTGGGTMILKDPMLCSDAEWADLEAGIIPPNT